MRPRALIAEDEPALRGEVRQALERLWPELDICAEVEDGLEAARVIEEKHPDVLFLDIAMPGMDGLEVARRASGRSHVVFITAFDEHAVAAFEEGAIDFLVKPLSDERLRRTVARLQARIGEAPPMLESLLAELRKALEGRRRRLRWISVLEGRDISATLDSANGGFGKNEGDNEITGIHISDGDPSVNGILGAKVPRFGHDGWRMFWTQQHGDNITWEVTRAKHGDNDDDRDDW